MIKIQLKTNKQEQQRIDKLVYDVTDNVDSERVVAVEDFDIKSILESDNVANLEFLETDDINKVKTLSKQSPARCNFCIIEVKNLQNGDLNQIEKLFTAKKELVAVIINSTLSKKYRINYLFK